MTETEPTEQRIRSFPQHEHNPFLTGLIVPTRGKSVALSTGKQLGLFDRETGEVMDDTAFMAVRQRVDTAEFVKIYKSQMKAMFDLSPRAMKVFGYLMHATRASTDRIVFSMRECREFTEYTSDVSIQKAVAELLTKQFIARTDVPSLYYLNPAMFFNGDRIVMMREVVRKGSKRDAEIQRDDPWKKLQQENQPTLDDYAQRKIGGSKEKVEVQG